MPLNELINLAYSSGGHDLINTGQPIEGAPSWLTSDTYTILAKTQNDTPMEVMMGPMLQSLLQDRFGLKVHRERKRIDTYSLIVGKSGPKMKGFEGECVPLGSSKASFPAGLRPCLQRGEVRGGAFIWDYPGASVGQFIAHLERSQWSELPITDNTGITGLFDFHLVFAADSPKGAQRELLQAQLGGVLEKQLGLKLQRSWGFSDQLVIDHVERRPVAN